MRTLLLSFIMLLLPTIAGAQKAYKPLKTALKDKNYKEAVAQINKLRADSTYRFDTKLCLYGIEAYRGLNDAENMKVYLKQNCDTVALFSTTYQIVKEAVILDSLENENKKNKGEKPHETKLVNEMLQRYYPNLNVAARFFYKKQNYTEAMRYLRYCIDLPHTPIGARSNLSTKHDVQNAVLYLSSAFATKNYAEVHRYENIALCDSVSRKSIMKFLARTAEAEKDTLAYERMLRQGWKMAITTKVSLRCWWIFTTHTTNTDIRSMWLRNTLRFTPKAPLLIWHRAWLSLNKKTTISALPVLNNGLNATR